MKPDQGLWTDGNPEEQPDGTYRNADHAVFDKSRKTLSKELGTSLYCNLIPANKIHIGDIEIEGDIVIFLEDSVGSNDEIGLIDKSGKYSTILLSTSLFFDRNYPIKAKFIKNVKNQRIIFFTDGLNKVRFLNIDIGIDDTNPVEEDKRLQLLSPQFDHISQNFAVDSTSHYAVQLGGVLTTGAYIPMIRYKTKEGITTNWSFPCEVLYVTAMKVNKDNSLGNPNINSGKQIVINLDNIDSDYDSIEVGAIASIQEQVTAKSLYEQKLDDSVTTNLNNFSITISDYNIGETLDLAEVISDRYNYETVNDIEVHEDELLLVGCKDKYQINYQKYANNIKINYRVDSNKAVQTYNSEDDSFLIKGFYPGEVYAFYIVFEYHDGSHSKAYHIPGRAAVGNDKDTSSFNKDFVNSKFTVRKFHVEDTADKGGASSNMGYWENANEFYPETDDFNSASVGGSDLRGLPVRHHRFPSIRHIRSLYESGNPEFGLNQLPFLSVDVSNVVIPSGMEDRVRSWRIYYAKRTTTNSTTLGSDVLLAQSDYDVSTTNNRKVFAPLPIHEKWIDGANRRSVKNAFRFHSFDLLYNKPEIDPAFLFLEYRIKSDFRRVLDDGNGKINTESEGYRSGWHAVYDAGKKWRATISRIKSDTTTVSSSISTEYIVPVLKHKYVAPDTITGDIDNRMGEEHLHLELLKDIDYISTGDTRFNSENNYNDKSYLATLKRLPSDVYQKFYTQQTLVATDRTIQITSSGIKSQNNIGGGDSHGYLHNVIATGPVTGNDPYVGTSNGFTGVGFFCNHYYATYSVSMLNRRYYQEGDIQSAIFPVFKYINSMVFEFYDATKGQTLLYSKDYSLLNEVNSIQPYDPINEIVNNYPNRIHKSNKLNNTSINVVPTFSSDGIYEMPKDKGNIIGINAFDDRLIIRHERTTYITAPRQSLKTSQGQDLSVADNDLFDLAPDELMTVDKGFAGSRSKFSSSVSEYGTIIVDEEAGKVFLVSKQGGLEEISKNGMKNFFNDNLSILNNYLYTTYNSISTGKWGINDYRYYDIPYNSNTWNKFNIGDYIYDSLANVTGKITNIKTESSNLRIYTDVNSPVTTTLRNIDHVKRIDAPSIVGGVIVSYDPLYERFLIHKKDKKSLTSSQKELFRGFYTGQGDTGSIYIHNSGLFIEWGNAYLGVTDNSFVISYYPNPEYKFWGSFHSSFKVDKYIQFRNGIAGIPDILNPVIYKFNSLPNINNAFGSSYEFLLEVIHNPQSEISKRYYRIHWDTKMIDVLNQIVSNDTFDSIELRNSYQSIAENTLNIYVNVNNRGNVRKVANIWKYGIVRTTEALMKDEKYLTDSFLSIIFRESSANQLFVNVIEAEYNVVDSI